MLIPTPLVVTATPTPSPLVVVATPTPAPATPAPPPSAAPPSPAATVATPTPAAPPPAAVGGVVAAPPTPVRLVVKADARLPWQDTKAIVLAGQRLRIRVVGGSWTHWKGTAPYQGGEGTGYVCGRPACVEPMPEVGNGSLIGRIGSQMFPIGSGAELTAAESGTLSLAINDGFDGLRDNDGVLTVEVTISQW